MADSRALYNGLVSYHQALEKHLQELILQYQDMETSWYKFNTIYEGDAANTFKRNWIRTISVFEEYIAQTERISSLLDERITALRKVNQPENILGGGNVGSPDKTPSTIDPQLQVIENSITWSERQEIWRRIENGELITTDDFNKLTLPISDLQFGTLVEDNSWLASSLDEYYEIMKDSREAEGLLDAILVTLKAINYGREK